MHATSRFTPIGWMARAARSAALALVSAVLLAGTSAAQSTGRVSGVVIDDSRSPVAGAQLTLTGTTFGTISGLDGRYRITNVTPGTYSMRVQRLGQRPRDITDVVVRAGEETVTDVTLATAATTLSGVVVAASRRVEKLTDAPATITSIGTDLLESTVGNTYSAALKEVKGLDYIQIGMTTVAVNARGFNSAFNNRMLQIEDGRISVIPESGLPIGWLTPTPKVDLAGIEVLVGPGSALYGPDASNGVVASRTKDPRAYRGTTIEVTGGNRGYRDIQARYANVAGNWGYKVAGEYQTADDFENFLSYNVNGTIVPKGSANSVSESALKDGIDWNTGVMRGIAAATYYRGDSRFEVNGGMSRTDNIAQTNVGRNQVRDWDFKLAQARYTTPHWYFNAYGQQSTSGKSFALNRFAGAQLNTVNANVSTDSLRKLSDWPSDGRMYAAEVQGNYAIAPLLNTTAVFGAQYRNDVVSSDRQWLWDRVTGEDVSVSQSGAYLQTTTPVSRFLDVVLAGRYDKPENYDEQWSPKAGVVVKPWTDHAFRVTFNRAYKSPTVLQTSFFIPDWTAGIAIFGNTGGFVTTNASGTVLATYQAMRPETNKTWEYGYKGILADRLLVDATYFRSDFENFMSPLTVVGFPAAGTYAKPLVNPGNNIPVNAQGQIVNNAPTPTTPAVLTYYNLGNAIASGVDAGVTAILTDRFELRGTLSTVKIDELTVAPGSSPEATALNAPTTKWTLGTTARNIGPFTAALTFRNVNAYYFRSGTNSGIVPTFGSLDANISLKVPQLGNSLVSLSLGNLFSCTSEKVTYSTPVTTPASPPNSRIASSDDGCGFGRKHIEMINMPEIGPMVFLGLRYHR